MKIRFELTAKEMTLISAAASKLSQRFNSTKKTLITLLFGAKSEQPNKPMVVKVARSQSIQMMANKDENGGVFEVHVKEDYAIKANEMFCRYAETYISAIEAIVPLVGIYANRIKDVIEECSEFDKEDKVEIYQLAPDLFTNLEVFRELSISYDTTFSKEEGKGRIIFKFLGARYGINVDASDFDSNRELFNSDLELHILGIDSSGDLVQDIEALNRHCLIWNFGC